MKTVNDIDPLWAAEFCGLFWGEGHLALSRTSRVWSKVKKNSTEYVPIPGPFYRTAAQISLRDDDRPLLEEIQSVLGGGLYKEHWNHPDIEHPRLCWKTRNKQESLLVGAVLLRGKMNAKKRREVETWVAAVNLHGSKGRKSCPDALEKFEEHNLKLKAMRKYVKL